MKPAITLSVLTLLALTAVAPARAQVPGILNYQGRVTVGGTNLTTNAAQFKFALLNGDGTEVYWRNDGSTAAGEPSGAVSVAVAQGLYSILLGDTNLGNMAPIPPAVFANESVNLRVWFGTGTNGFVQLNPDQRIGAAGYALRAATADITNVPGSLDVAGTLSAFRIVGGEGNLSTGPGAFIGGGQTNTASGTGSVVAGGEDNAAGDEYAVVGGGYFNKAAGYASVISGGYDNRADGLNATVPGGYQNRALGSDSFAAGVQSQAIHGGSFVWNGVAGVVTVSTNTNSFTVRAPGGVRFLSTTATNAFVGVVLANGATQWASLSDRESKMDFQPVEPREILAKVSALPVTSWRYRHDPQRRYIGPMAQDFHTAFGLGSDDKTIGTLDSDGVIYAAIKGLVEELRARDEVIDELKSKLEGFEQRLDSLPPAP